MINCVIVDDEKRACNVLKKILVDYYPGEVNVCATANSASEGAVIIREHKPHLVFLDVEMVQGDGFSLLENIPEIDFRVVFITAHSHYAIKAIRFSALDYLLKPVNIDELGAAIARCRQSLATAEGDRKKIETLRTNLDTHAEKLHRIALPGASDIQFVEIANILRLEASSNYTCFFLDSGEKILVSRTLKEYEDLLAPYGFVRVHNSHIIHTGKVTRYIRGKGGYAVMSDGSHVDISPKRKDAFLRYFVSL